MSDWRIMPRRSINRRRFVGGIAAFAAMGSAAVRAQGTGTPGAATGTPAVPPKAPASNLQSAKELVIGQQYDPTTLDPTQTTNAVNQGVYGQIVEQLVIFDTEGATVQPWLAESFAWADDKTLTLHLRQGISFSNGESFDAQSAKFSIDQFAASKFYAFLLPKDVYEAAEVVDDHTVQVHLKRPFAPFLGFLARGGSALPVKYYQQVGTAGFSKKPVGTGPFTLSEWSPGDHVTLVRNPKYWNGPHPLAKVTFRIIPEDTSRIAALQAGEIDIAALLPVDALGPLKSNDKAQAVVRSGLRKFAMHFDTTHGDTPLKDKRVRTALNLAVDKEAIAKSLYQGAADPLQGQWEAKQEFGFAPDIAMFPYDPTQAKSLLGQAGLGNGFDLQLTYTVGRYPLDKQLGEVVTSFLQQIGVKVTPRALEYGAFQQQFDARTIGTQQWGLLLPPEPYFNYSLFTQGSIYEWHDLGPKYTQLVNDASATTARDKQQALYEQAAAIMHDDPPMLYLLIPRDIYGVNKRVQGFQPRTDQVLWLFGVNVS